MVEKSLRMFWQNGVHGIKLARKNFEFIMAEFSTHIPFTITRACWFVLHKNLISKLREFKGWMGVELGGLVWIPHVCAHRHTH